MQPRPADALDVIVIGAGQAGLATAYHLRAAACGSSSSTPPPSSGTPGAPAGTRCGCSPRREYDGLPGMAFPAPADTYPTKDEVADYLRGVRRAVRAARPARLRGRPARAARRRLRRRTPRQGTLLRPPGRGRHRPVPDPGRPAGRRGLGRRRGPAAQRGVPQPGRPPAGPGRRGRRRELRAPDRPRARRQPRRHARRRHRVARSCRSGSSAATCSGG